MKLLRKKYSINLDGEIFWGKNDFLKSFLLRKADKYYVAGEKATANCNKILKTHFSYPYYFSSLKEKDLINNRKCYEKNNQGNFILIVGRYVKEKGIDIALEVAKMNQNIIFKIVGMRENEIIKVNKKIAELNLVNVDIIPFVDKQELDNLYKECKCLLMPSIKECWGLVVNEAASFGTPIVATIGSGAAIEFLNDKYSNFLAKPNNAEDLSQKLNNLLNYDEMDKYKKFLIEKSKNYSIEKSVDNYTKIFNI